ncbi:MAG: hypothetical protein AB8F26_00980 [Phycisphaerales bacterium]
MDPRINNRQATIRVPGPLGQLLALACILAVAILGVLIAIPLLIVGAVLLLGFLGVTWVRLKFRRAKAPNGPLDGRHNVRVIRRDE